MIIFGLNNRCFYGQFELDLIKFDKKSSPQSKGLLLFYMDDYTVLILRTNIPSVFIRVRSKGQTARGEERRLFASIVSIRPYERNSMKRKKRFAKILN